MPPAAGIAKGIRGRRVVKPELENLLEFEDGLRFRDSSDSKTVACRAAEPPTLLRGGAASRLRSEKPDPKAETRQAR